MTGTGSPPAAKIARVTADLSQAKKAATVTWTVGQTAKDVKRPGPTEPGDGTGSVSEAVQAAVAKDAKDWTLDEQKAVAEDAVADPEDYATHFQRCRDYLADGLGDSFDQTASYVYTNPAGDSWEIEVRGDDEIASPIAEPNAKQPARRR